MSNQATPVCPPGFDCALYNSCPKYIQPCPDGFFCGSYEGFPHQGVLDLRYAELANFYTDITVTDGNKKKYLDKDRTFQAGCLKGFYCPDSTSMKICPDGHWCPERTVTPQACDGLSPCSAEGSWYQVNFVNALIMVLLVGTTLTSSSLLLRRQKRSDTESRNKDPSSKDSSAAATQTQKAASSEPQLNSQNQKIKHVLAEGTINIKFANITFVTPTTKATILPGISGKIPAGKITGILGPTSCGKSTLLNSIRSCASNCVGGHVSVTIRDTKTKMELVVDRDSFEDYVGYVPQEDILDRDLTVRELLTFNALARTKGSKTTQEITLLVDQVLSDLAIAHIGDAVIGGGENKAANISGGQLKRVNIACELVALSRPSVLLLDEPTAGLDATIAFELMETLETVRNRGITIVVVLQQPRAEIFERIDHLFLMNSSGGIIYEGHSPQAVPYLRSLGYEPNEETSDADFCLDVLNGIVQRNESAVSQKFLSNRTELAAMPEAQQLGADEGILEPQALHLLWKSTVNNLLSSDKYDVLEKNHQHPATSTANDGDDFYGTASIQYSSQRENNTFAKRLEIFLFATWLNSKRLITVRLRNRGALFVYIFINLIMAIALSSGFSILLQSSYYGVLTPPVDTYLQAYFPSAYSRYSSGNVSSVGFAQLLFFMSSALGCASCLTSVPVFAGVQSLAKREYRAGISVVAFGLGRILADLLFVIANGFVFAGIWCLFGHAGSFYDWIAVIICTAFASSGIGYIASAISPKNSASVVAIILCFICCVFAGVEPTLAQVEQYPVVSWPWYLSFATWTAEATYITWSKYLTNDGDVPVSLQDGADAYGYTVDDGFGRSIGSLVTLGVVMRALSVYILWRKVTKN